MVLRTPVCGIGGFRTVDSLANLSDSYRRWGKMLCGEAPCTTPRKTRSDEHSTSSHNTTRELFVGDSSSQLYHNLMKSTKRCDAFTNGISFRRHLVLVRFEARAHGSSELLARTVWLRCITDARYMMSTNKNAMIA